MCQALRAVNQSLTDSDKLAIGNDNRAANMHTHKHTRADTQICLYIRLSICDMIIITLGRI